MPNDHDAKPTTGQYGYHRSTDGCDDTFLIEDASGQCILQVHFWAEPDTSEAAIAEAKAQMLVAALNLQGGGWVLPPYPHWTLYHDKQIAAIWGIEDLEELRPDLTADQAWQVLQQVSNDHDRDRGITRNIIRRAAEELFPVAGQQKLKRRLIKNPHKPPTPDEIRF